MLGQPFQAVIELIDDHPGNVRVAFRRQAAVVVEAADGPDVAAGERE